MLDLPSYVSQAGHANGDSQRAEKAVELYKNLYTPEEVPNKKQKESKDRLVKSAEAVLACAKEDAVLFPHAYTEEDIQADIEALKAHGEKEEAVMEASTEAGMEARIAQEPGQIDVAMREEGDVAPVSQAESLPNMLSEAQETGGAEARDAEDDEDALPRLPTPPRSRGRLV